MITDQKLGTAELLFNCAKRLGLEPVWLQRNILFAIKTAEGERYLKFAQSVFNSQLSSGLVGNKLSARMVLDRYDLPNMPYLSTSSQDEAKAFLAKYKKIIVKPQFGSNSRDVHIIEEPQHLESFDLQKYILEQYAPGREIRYLILNDEIIGVHESKYGESVAQNRDLQRISYPEADWDPALAETALRVAKIFGLRYGAVDYIVDASGTARILEVNSSPGMKWFHAPTSGPMIDVARLFLEAMLDDLRDESLPTPDPLGVYPAVAYN